MELSILSPHEGGLCTHHISCSWFATPEDIPAKFPLSCEPTGCMCGPPNKNYIQSTIVMGILLVLFAELPLVWVEMSYE